MTQMKQTPTLLPAFLQAQQQPYRLPFSPMYSNFANGASSMHSIFPSSTATMGQYLAGATPTAVDLGALPRKKRSKVTDSSQRHAGKMPKMETSGASTPQAPSMVFTQSPSLNGSPHMDGDQV